MARSWLRSFLAGIEFHLGLAGTVILIISLFGVALFLIPISRSSAEMRFAIVLALVICSMLIWAIVIWFKGSPVSNARKKNLHLAFNGLADISDRYTRTGLRFHGVFRGRNFDAYVTQVKEAHAIVHSGVYAGEHLEIILDSNIKARLRAGQYDQQLSSIGSRLNGDMSTLTEGIPESLIAFSFDADWGRRIMKDKQAAELFIELLTPLGQTEVRNLSLWPGGAMIDLHRLNPADLTTMNVKNWLSLLADWLERLEGLPPPERLAVGNRWDALRGDRKRIITIGLAILVSVLFLITILILGLIWLLIR